MPISSGLRMAIGGDHAGLDQGHELRRVDPPPAANPRRRIHNF